MLDLALSLDDDRPRGPRLAEAIRAAILDGRLAPGVRLPGARSLARQLAVARNTVAESYETLASEGYVTSRQGSGTYVVEGLPEEIALDVPAPSAGEGGGGRAARPTAGLVERLFHDQLAPPPRVAPALPFDLRPGILPIDLFPFREWRAHFNRALDELRATRTHREPEDDVALRREIAAYLGRARAVRCHPDEIVVTVGAQQAFDLVGRLVLDPGDSFAIEDPSYPGARHALLVAGGRPVPIPVDDEGMDVAVLAERSAAAPVRLAYVTPSHQYPTGTSLSLPRRLALVAWAAERGSWILEDDYASEFRYAGRPLPALQGLDSDRRTIYVGTFSKVLHPSVRVGYAVFPPDLTEPALRLKWALDRRVPSLTHMVLATFMAEGGFERHLRRLRRAYHRRQQALAAPLAAGLAGLAEVTAADAGLQLVVRLGLGATERDEAEILARAADRGLAAYPLAAFHVAGRAPAGLVLGFAALPEPALEQAAHLLSEVVRSWARAGERRGRRLTGAGR